MSEYTRYPEREIFCNNGQYLQCQILNWRDGPPPRYLACNVLTGPRAGNIIYARQGMGTWMEPDWFEIAQILNAETAPPVSAIDNIVRKRA